MILSEPEVWQTLLPRGNVWTGQQRVQTEKQGVLEKKTLSWFGKYIHWPAPQGAQAKKGPRLQWSVLVKRTHGSGQFGARPERSVASG